MVNKQTSARNASSANPVQAASDTLGKQMGHVGREVQQAQQDAKQLGKDAQKVLRPFQRVMAFAVGTIKGGLQGMSRYGRMGATLGLAVGVFGMIMTGGSMAIPFLGVAAGAGGWTAAGVGVAGVGWFAGIVTGATIGGIVGALKGGPTRVALEERKAKYADEIDARNANMPRGRSREFFDARSYNDYKEDVSEGNFDRFQQRFDLAAEDTSASWADRVSGGPSAEHGR